MDKEVEEDMSDQENDCLPVEVDEFSSKRMNRDSSDSNSDSGKFYLFVEKRYDPLPC